MKNFRNLIKTWIPILGVAFAFALMSCEKEEEIIALESEDLSLDYSKVTKGVLIGSDGELIGTYDDSFNFIGTDNGSGLAKTDDNNLFTPIVIYDQTGFKGNNQFFKLWSSLHGQVLTLSDYGSLASFNKNIGSFVLAPRCNVEFFDDNNTRKFFRNDYSDNPKYWDFGILLGAWKNRITKMAFTCDSSKIQKGNLCGIGYENNDYKGASVPFFRGTDNKLDGKLGAGTYNFAKSLSSISINKDSNCSGLMVYSDSKEFIDDNPSSKDYHWIHPDVDHRKLSNHGMDNRIRRVVDFPEVEHDFRRLKRNRAVGLIAYEQSGYSGDFTIFYKGSGSRRFIYPWSYGSYVVASGSTLVFENVNGNNLAQEGYHNRPLIMTDYIISGSSQNDYCGALFEPQDDEFRKNERHLPIFQGLTNFSLNSGRQSLRLSAVAKDFNNSFSSFMPSEVPTNCKGITLWDAVGTKHTENGKRFWLPVLGRKLNSTEKRQYILPAGINNKPSVISTEGCTTCATGFILEGQNLASKAHSDIYKGYYSGLQLKNANQKTSFGNGLNYLGRSYLTRQILESGKNKAGHIFSGLTASAIATYFGWDPYAVLVGSGVTTAALTCAVNLYDHARVNSKLIKWNTFPGPEGWTKNNTWKRVGLKVAALSGMYPSDKNSVDRLETQSFNDAMKDWNFLVPLPTLRFPGNMVGLNSEVGEISIQYIFDKYGYVELTEVIEKLSRQGVGQLYRAPVLKWLKDLKKASEIALKTDIYLTSMELVRNTANGVFSGFMIGTGVDQAKGYAIGFVNELYTTDKGKSSPEIIPTSLITGPNCTKPANNTN